MPVRQLNKELELIAKNELGENPATVESDLRAIKEWLAKQDHIKARIDDQWLIAFLRGCKFKLERTKEKVDNYYTMKSLIPELAKGVDPMEPNMQQLMDMGFYVVLPKPCSNDGPRVLLCRPGLYEGKKFNVIEILRLTYLYTCVQILEDDQIMIAGQIVLADATGVSLSHLSQMTPSNIKKLVMTRQDSLPIRQKGIHHFNNPSGLETVFNIFRTFVSEKHKARFHVHSSMENIYKYVPKEILPTELGGDAGPVDNMIGDMKKKIESYRQWFLDDVQFRTEESKRPGKPKTSKFLDSVEGSFKQLAID